MAESLPAELAEMTESRLDWAGLAGRISSGMVTELRVGNRMNPESSFSGIGLRKGYIDMDDFTNVQRNF